MTNVLHLHERYSRDKHQDSMMASLTHRLAIARANNNVSLVALLEQEKQQVAPRATSGAVRSRTDWWKAITQYVADVLFGGTDLQVVEMVDGRDRWWVASNPQTGEIVYADSEAELRLWIEENYQGQ